MKMQETEGDHRPPNTPVVTIQLPNTPSRLPSTTGILSPTFREEQHLERQETVANKEQAKDSKVKTRVRIAKLFLRGINFSCSVIVLSMVATTFAIFNATRTLPARNNLPPWAENTKTWPQIVVLVISCVSLLLSILIMIGYCRGGHRGAEKVASYYTIFAVVSFVFSIVMWAVGAAVLHQSKANSHNKDMWGWSCVDNTRRHLFEDHVSYALVCRLQNWSLVCCFIEIVVEIFTVTIYGIIFYRFWSKRKLRKSIVQRDDARSNLYMAQIRTQSTPNTPGFGPLSPRSGGWRPPPSHPIYADSYSETENGESKNVQYASVHEATNSQPVTLQPPPSKVTGTTPMLGQDGSENPA